MERATGKAERLLQIEALLLEHPEGLSQAEIARRVGVNRSTVYRYLPDLTNRFAIYEADDGRLAIDRDHYLMNVRLTLHESMALHLAARLMATRTDKRNPHAAAALRKLGLALEKLAPRIAEHLCVSAEVMEDQAQRHDPVYLDVLETLTRAWSGLVRCSGGPRLASDDGRAGVRVRVRPVLYRTLCRGPDDARHRLAGAARGDAHLQAGAHPAHRVDREKVQHPR